MDSPSKPNGTHHFHVVLDQETLEFDPINERLTHDPNTDEFLRLTPDKILIRKSLTHGSSETQINYKGSLNYTQIKLSYDKSMLCLQTGQRDVTFLYMNNSKPHFHQTCHNFNKEENIIKDFFWLNDRFFVYVTKLGFEVFEYDPKNATKPLTRTVEKTALITWFKFSNRIVLYKRQDDDLIYGIHFQCNKYDEEFKVFLRELVPVKIDAVGPLYEEDVLLAKVYDRFYCMYVNSAKYLLDMYKITYKQKPNEFTDKRISINLYTPGSVRISIVDNLIISHNIAKNVSMIYDIKAHETIQDNTLGFLVSPLPMTAIENEGNRIIEKYPECVFLLPNLVVNKGNGKIQKINVDLKSLSDSFSDPCLLNSFLLRRTRGKPYILEHLSQLMTDRKNLESLGVIFNQINTVLCAHQRKNGAKSPSSVAIAKERVLQYWSNSKETTPITLPENQVVNMENGKIVIDQHDMYTKVFVPLEETCTDSKYMVSIFSEYIKSLNFLGIKVDSFIYELIINVLVRNKRFYQLHQLLQYYVINDSHHVACQLLHIQSMYPPALQLALDMLKRLNDSSQIVEVLFTKGMVLNALKYLNSFPEKSVIKPLAPRFLEEAKKKNDLSLFHITYTFFKSNNFIDESCSEYVEYYKETCVHNQAPEL